MLQIKTKPKKSNLLIVTLIILFSPFAFVTKSVGNSDLFYTETDSIILSFSHERNFYNSPFNLKITSNNPNASIYYTTDCSLPGKTNGKLYKTGIAIDSTTIVKAIAISGSVNSVVYTQSYLFSEFILRQPKLPAGYPATWGGSSIISADYEMDPNVVNNPLYSTEIRQAFNTVPALSLSMSINDWFNPSTGLYVGYPNTDITREKAIHAEFIFPEKEKNFSIPCGLQNQGGTSIVNWKVPKQSMRLLFKEPYGPTRLRYQLFEDSEIKSINTLVVDAFLYGWVHPFDSIQRNTSLFFRDQLCSDLQNKMGWKSFHGKYINLFINGLYWGMYDLHERPDDAFLSEYFDEPAGNFEILKHNPNNIVQGSNLTYNQMLEMARNGMSKKENLDAIQKFLDIQAFIDYMLLNFYLGNFDWAHQNYYVSRNWELPTSFRFYTWDAEHVMRYSDVNFNNTLKSDKGGPTEIHSFLKLNEEYRMMFADAVYKHCFNNGALTPENFMESFLFRKNEIDKLVILESARWGDFLKKTSKTTYTKNTHWLPEVEKVIKNYIPNRRAIFISQLQNPANNLFPDVMPPIIKVISDTPGSKKAITLTQQNLAEGDIYFTIDDSDPRLTGGAIRGTKYSKPVTFDKPLVIKARFRSKSKGIWSALAEEMVLFDKKSGEDIVINEIMYKPEDGFPEYIELTNKGEIPVNLKGFEISKGLYHSFYADYVLFPGASLVLTSDTILFKKVYNFSAFSQFKKQLNNAGETILLKNKFSQVIDSVSFTDTIPWPKISGNGYSIEFINLNSDNSLPQNWKASKKNGTPFKMETKLSFSVSAYPNPVTEFLTLKIVNPELSVGLFRIELLNQTGTLVQSADLQAYNSILKINFTGIIKGLYLIRIKPLSNSQYGNQVVKVVKLR